MEVKFRCTECEGDAFIAYAPEKIKRGKDKGKEIASWGGKVLPGERLCLSCGKKRGVNFF